MRSVVCGLLVGIFFVFSMVALFPHDTRAKNIEEHANPSQSHNFTCQNCEYTFSGVNKGKTDFYPQCYGRSTTSGEENDWSVHCTTPNWFATVTSDKINKCIVSSPQNNIEVKMTMSNCNPSP